MENSPLVSVIVPVYNMEQYLGETLDSVSTVLSFQMAAVWTTAWL